jgi:alpha-ketoglutarate-dependent sulfate ester dioxygenase
MTSTIALAADGTADGAFAIRPLSPLLGAEVEGLDLAQPLSPASLAALREALRDWKVLFFRNQHVSHADHVRFGRQLGSLAIPTEYDPFYPTSYDEERPPTGYSDEEVRVWRDYPELTRVDNRRAQEFDAKRLAKDPSALASRNTYREAHVDSLAFVNPPVASILRAETVPAYGGDTFWFDAVAAYEGLSAPVRQLADSLWAEYVTVLPTHFEDSVATTLVTHHPVVRVIPETGKRALCVGPIQTKRILDVTPDESRWILAHLFEQISRPAYGVRFRWDATSIGMWDNRTTLHLGPQDLAPDVDRVMQLVFVGGEVPVSVDGHQSVAIQGDPKPHSDRALADAE